MGRMGEYSSQRNWRSDFFPGEFYLVMCSILKEYVTPDFLVSHNSLRQKKNRERGRDKIYMVQRCKSSFVYGAKLEREREREKNTIMEFLQWTLETPLLHRLSPTILSSILCARLVSDETL